MRKDGFMPFSTVLVGSEMQTVSCKICTWVIDSISYNAKCNGYHWKGFFLRSVQILGVLL